MKILDKPTPSTRLHIVQGFVRTGTVTYTNSALNDADELLNADGMLSTESLKIEIKNVLLSLTWKDFDKSMTTKADHTIWQDVYRPSHQVGDLYVKITVVISEDKVQVISFKQGD